MKAKKKYTSSKKVKKYNMGSQTLNPNIDPTTQYEINRGKTSTSVADTDFNNAQQSLINQGLQQQQLQDKTANVLGQYGSTQTTKTATDSTVASGLSSMGTLGKVAAAGYGLGTKTGDRFNQKSMDQALATGEGNKTNKQLATIFTPTSSKLLSAKNAADVGEAFVPIKGLFGKSSQDIAEETAVEAQNKQRQATEQINKYGKVDTNYQNVQAKDGKKKLKTRIIETEGREPILSPKKSDGKRDLLYYNPNAPTHKEGGVKAAVVQSGKDKIRGILNIPQGSAIVTAKGGMNKKAIEAYKKGDDKTLEKIINTMPEDKPSKPKKKYGSKFDYGVDELERRKGNLSASSDVFVGNTSNDVNQGFGFGKYSSLNRPQEQTTPQVASTETKGSNLLGKASNIGTGLMEAAPSIYNLGRGLFEKPEKTTRRYIANKGYKYKDMSASARRAANEARLIESENIRNTTGGSGSSFLANQAIASANKFKNISDINLQESGKRQNIRNANVDIRNQQNQANLALTNQYDDLDLQNKAAKTGFLGAGLTGFSDLSFNNRLMKNQAEADRIRANTLETPNYKYNVKEEKNIFKAKGTKKLKGNNSLRYKKK